MKRPITLLAPLALIAMLLLSACAGSREPAAATPQAPNATAPASGGNSGGAGGLSPKKTATPGGTAAEATPAPKPTKPSTTAGSSADTGGLQQIQEVESISSYRQKTIIETTGAAFEDEDSSIPTGNVVMEVSFRRDPEPAYQIEVKMADAGSAGAMGNISLIKIGDKSYTNMAGTWIEMGSGDLFDIDQMMMVDLSSLAGSIDQMEKVGQEEVNGRSTTHYRGDREAIAAMQSEGGTFDKAKEAQIDIWIDDEEQFIVKMDMSAAGVGLNADKPDADGSMHVTTEYYDFNADDIVIEVPDTSTSLSGSLGFDLALPEGAKIDFTMGPLSSISFKGMTQQEVTTFMTEQMTSNGFTVAESSAPDFGTLVFNKDGKEYTMIVTESGGTVNVMITSPME